jgi:hypothetical protein
VRRERTGAHIEGETLLKVSERHTAIIMLAERDFDPIASRGVQLHLSIFVGDVR